MRWQSALQSIVLYSLLGSVSLHTATPQYETYLESWDGNWQTVLDNMPAGPNGAPAFQNVVVDFAFGDFYFTGLGGEIEGLQFSNPYSAADVATAIQMIQSGGGKAKISFGGLSYPIFGNNTNPYVSNGWNNGIGVVAMANNLMPLLTQGYTNGSGTFYFDGVDFDIENQQPPYTNPLNPYDSSFAQMTISAFSGYVVQFLAQVYSNVQTQIAMGNLPADFTVSLTVPGQGWTGISSWVQCAVQIATGALTTCDSCATCSPVTGSGSAVVDYVNFMEYDIYVPPGGGPNEYPLQIAGDIITYITAPPGTIVPLGPNTGVPGWGIPSTMTQMGLMPGLDDNGNCITLAAAEDLAIAAATPIDEYFTIPGQGTYTGYGLRGVMTWDLNRDAESPGASGPSIECCNPSGECTVPSYPAYSYPFTVGIRDAMSLAPPPPPMIVPQVHVIRPLKEGPHTVPPFVHQPPPPHGAP